MKFAKNVVVAVGMNDDVSKLLSPLRAMSFLSHSEIHFVHVFQAINYATYLGNFPLAYPLDADRTIIIASIESFLQKLSTEVLPSDFQGRIHCKCLFDERPKNKLCGYAQEVHADLVIVPTRKRHGFFESSFAQFVNKHCSASTITLKGVGHIFD